MKRAVIYLRVSTTEQAETDYDPEGYSIPAQREACRRKAESLGVELIDEYLDLGASARSADRPALQKMLARIKQEQDVDYVIVHKVDRLARSRLDDVYINMALRESGARLVSVMENIDETPSGMMLHGIMATFAEFYSLNLATEIKKGMSQKAKVGGTASRAPVGYLNVREVVDGREIRTVKPDPDRAPLVQWAFEAYATGDYSLNRLLDELTDKGLTMRATAKQPERPLRLSGLSRMLHNAYYAGVVTWKGVQYPGRHQPLVSQALFNRVQAILEAHDRAGERSRVHHHYLKGSTFCGKCGARLGLNLATGKSGGQYLYFFCSNRHKGGSCPQRYLPAETVEQAVIDYYARLQTS